MTPTTTWREDVAPGEAAELEGFARQLVALQAGQDRPLGRALHLKAHVALPGELSVDDGLPEAVRQGLFATPGTYRCYLRFSNGAPRRGPDGRPDVRGLAVKVLGVAGKKLLFEHSTQDFLAIDTDRMPFATPREFVTVLSALSGKGALGAIVRQLGLGRTLAILAAVVRGAKGKPNDLLDVTFNTVLPMTFGPYAGRLVFAPTHAPSPRRPSAKEPDYIAARLAERARGEALAWTVGAQLYVDEKTTPIEDPRVPWSSPVVKLGSLKTRAFDLAGERGRAFASFVEPLSFDPWHALEAHRPLGAMMRARKVTYLASTRARGASGEPDGSEFAGLVG